MVIVDWFLKMIWLKVTTTNVLLEEIAKICCDDIWKLHKILRIDQGPQFTSRFIKELPKALETKRMLSTAYHPQTDVSDIWSLDISFFI